MSPDDRREHHAGTRTLRLTAPGIFKLLAAMSTGNVRAVSDVLPKGAAPCGTPRWNERDQVLEIDVVYHAWPADTSDTIGLLWAQQLSARDWGTAIAIDQPLAPVRA